jgi:hypothetical protein
MPEVSEQHFTPAELAKAWRVDVTTIRRMFIDVPGVLKLGRLTAGRGKRSYVTLRIPRDVAERFYQQLTR